jgi:hypothetical protein
MVRVKTLGGFTLKGDKIAGTRFVDRIAILRGRIVFFEVKRPRGGRRSPLQIFHIERLRAWGHEAYFVKTREEIDEILDGE